jgi:hypothetical protein
MASLAIYAVPLERINPSCRSSRLNHAVARIVVSVSRRCARNAERNESVCIVINVSSRSAVCGLLDQVIKLPFASYENVDVRTFFLTRRLSSRRRGVLIA